MSGQNRLFIPASIARTLPAIVKNELTKCSAQKQEEFIEEYKRRKKSLAVAYLLLFIFPVYYGYLKKWGLLVLYWFTGAGCMLWWFIDIFRLPGLVNNYNKDIAMDVMRSLVAISYTGDSGTSPTDNNQDAKTKETFNPAKLGELERVHALLKSGVITQEEFETLKRNILGN